MSSCPKELEAYDKAHELKMREKDSLEYMWWGNYAISSFIVAIDCCFNGKNAKSQFLKTPILEEMDDANKLLTEEELKRQRELFVASLEVMKTNFELNHKDSSV